MCFGDADIIAYTHFVLPFRMCDSIKKKETKEMCGITVLWNIFCSVQSNSVQFWGNLKVNCAEVSCGVSFFTPEFLNMVVFEENSRALSKK